MDTNYSGTYTSIAAVIVFILSKFGVNTDVTSILAIISAVLLVIGIIKQAYDHYKLGKVASSYAPKI